MKLLTPKETADRLGISTRWLRSLCKQGELPKRGEGKSARHPWPDVRKAYNEYLVRSALEKSGKDEYHRERAKLIALKREAAEYDLGLRRKVLMTLEQYDEAVGGAFMRVRRQLDTLEQRMAPDIIGIKTLRDARAKVHEHVSWIKQELYEAKDVPKG